jgi:AraC-like DNA-binding protein
MTIEPSRQTLESSLGAEAFPQTHMVLREPDIRAARLLCHRLPVAGSLEIEERALELLAAAAPARPIPAPAGRQLEIVEATQITLAARPEEAWSLHALARRVHSSPFYLARCFRRLAGAPLHRYHLRARLAAALGLVLDSKRDFTDIGLQLGFSSHSHFSAAFRRAFGMTPSQFRDTSRRRLPRSLRQPPR